GRGGARRSADGGPGGGGHVQHPPVLVVWTRREKTYQASYHPDGGREQPTDLLFRRALRPSCHAGEGSCPLQSAGHPGSSVRQVTIIRRREGHGSREDFAGDGGGG